ncbi:tetratricopeptide repeat protein [Leptospira ellisii]|uniref:Tetratricopeptide repeat protein n=1 Tax=Leptospira ellisii TaxID=2023197 RepID=A0AAE4QR02_9LEPT|nr:tetratricopeptide repeat protein [Leptospira ellisii]MDV6237597.1 tetratricopeptide repeat protein [Leptospira ellisii]
MNPKFHLYFSLLLITSFSVSSQETGFGGHEEGKRLLEEKHFQEAEKLALSLLSNNPSDPVAEFILASSYIGLGRESARKGNYSRAVELLQKASLKFPFDTALKDEILFLRKKQTQRNSFQSSFSSMPRNPSKSDLVQSIDELNVQLRTLIQILNSINEQQKEEPFTSKEKLLFGSQVFVIALLFISMFVSWKFRRQRS